VLATHGYTYESNSIRNPSHSPPLSCIHKVGISSARELGVVNINSFYKEMLELNKKLEIVQEVPDINSLKLWSKVVKLLT